MYTVDCDYVEDDDRRLDDVGTSELLYSSTCADMSFVQSFGSSWHNVIPSKTKGNDHQMNANMHIGIVHVQRQRKQIDRWSRLQDSSFVIGYGLYCLPTINHFLCFAFTGIRLDRCPPKWNNRKKNTKPSDCERNAGRECEATKRMCSVWHKTNRLSKPRQQQRQRQRTAMNEQKILKDGKIRFDTIFRSMIVSSRYHVDRINPPINAIHTNKRTILKEFKSKSTTITTTTIPTTPTTFPILNGSKLNPSVKHQSFSIEHLIGSSDSSVKPHPHLHSHHHALHHSSSRLIKPDQLSSLITSEATATAAALQAALTATNPLLSGHYRSPFRVGLPPLFSNTLGVTNSNSSNNSSTTSTPTSSSGNVNSISPLSPLSWTSPYTANIPPQFHTFAAAAAAAAAAAQADHAAALLRAAGSANLTPPPNSTPSPPVRVDSARTSNFGGQGEIKRSGRRRRYSHETICRTRSIESTRIGRVKMPT
ncbi:hypothetical protein RDWZM_007254 [Blomia tropicalis]|uniref:Uncharacterized protein n=1 Tax=Blomia tropicalis TaxID=40697 RepID=A0A9Q0MBD3_BLOTA|nr:hypothetical protein RDWZM_007254 [Blomia tropicalis]